MSAIHLREALDALAPEPALDGDLFDRVAGGVRRRRRRAGTAVLAAVAAAMLASPLAIHTSSPTRPRVPVPVDSGMTISAANWAAAQRDVAARLAAFPAPPGAHPLPGPPPDAPEISHPWSTGRGPNQAEEERWFSFPGDMSAAYLSLRSAAMAGQTPVSENAPGEPTFEVDWSWPDLTARVVGRNAHVTVVPVHGGVLMRIDVWAYWLPARPPEVTIGPDVASVTVLLHSKAAGMGDPTVPARTFGPTTIADPGRVADVASLVNGLSPALPWQGVVVSCPADFGGSMRVDFTDRSGRLLDRLEIALSGCATVQIIAGATTAQLAGPSAGLGLDQEILSLLGLDWTWTR